jgi:Zn-dependent protease with chaperone function
MYGDGMGGSALIRRWTLLPIVAMIGAALWLTPAVADDDGPEYQRDPETIRKDIAGWSERWPLEEERKVGKDVAKEVDEAYGLLDWPEQTERIKHIVERLARASDRPAVEYDVAILDTSIPNAMAITGGYIRVTRGLLEMVQSDDELAGVLGHEMAHNTLFHGLRQAERDSDWQKLEMIALLGVLVGAGLSGDPSVLQTLDVITLSMFARIGVLSSYSRRYEHEADWTGLRYAHDAGYDPTGFYTFMERLHSYELTSQPMLPSDDPRRRWDSHPLTPQRLAEIRSYFHQQSLSFNRAAVCDGFVATVRRSEVAEGLRVWEVLFHDQVIYQLSPEPVDGASPAERAREIANRINDLVQRRGIDVPSLGVRKSSGYVTLHGLYCIPVHEADARLMGMTLEEYTEASYKAFRSAVYQAEQDSRTDF